MEEAHRLVWRELLADETGKVGENNSKTLIEGEVEFGEKWTMWSFLKMVTSSCHAEPSTFF